MKIWTKYWLVISICLYATVGWSEEPTYYRYKDKDGNTVISSSLPPEYANSGYETLNNSLSVIEKVPPRKSDAEIAKEAALQKEQLEKQRQAQIELEKKQQQEHKDEVLLKSFNTEQDIERTRNDKLSSIKVLEEIVKENMQGLERQLGTARNAAATYQQAGQKVPEKIQQTIDDSVRQINDSKEFLERKAAEKKDIQAKYELLLGRFKELEKSRLLGKETAPPVTTAPANPQP